MSRLKIFDWESLTTEERSSLPWCFRNITNKIAKKQTRNSTKLLLDTPAYEALRELMAISAVCDTRGEERNPFHQDGNFARAREVGVRLFHEQDNISSMRSVMEAYTVCAKTAYPWAYMDAKLLDLIWDGVGGWRRAV